MGWILGAMGILIEYPGLAAGIGVVLLGLGLGARRRFAVGAGLIWLLYGLYEWGMQRRWLCSGECNIRLDLFIIYPLLLIALGAAAIGLLRAPRSKRPPA